MKGGIEMDGEEKKIRVKKDEQGERDKRTDIEEREERDKRREGAGPVRKGVSETGREEKGREEKGREEAHKARRLIDCGMREHGKRNQTRK